MKKDYSLSEAFKELDSLTEDSFNLNDKEDLKKLQDFYDGDNVDDSIERIIDINAETEEELKDSYVGNIIIECYTCKTKIYKEETDVVISEDDETICNLDEECPHCHSTNGYTIIGRVAPYVEETKDEEKSVEDEVVEEPKEETAETSIEKEEPQEEVEEPNNNKASKELDEKIVKRLCKKNLKESSDYHTIYNELLDDAKSNIDDGYNVTDAIWDVIDNGLIYDADILELAKNYNAIDYSELLQVFYDDLFSDLAEDLMEYIDTGIKDDESNITESKNDKHCNNKGYTKHARLREGNNDKWYVEPRYAWEVWEQIRDKFNERGIARHIASSIEEEDILAEYVSYLCKILDFTPDYSIIDKGGKITESKNNRKSSKQLIEKIVEDTPTTTKSLNDLTKCDKCKGELDKDFKCPECDTNNEEVEVDLEEIDEKLFDSLATKYINEIYTNVNNYSTTKGYIDEEDNKLVLEGLITFKSGKAKPTKFIFEGTTITKRGKVKLQGLNESFSKNKRAFTLQGSINNGKLKCENLTYNYYVKTNLNESKKIYGRVDSLPTRVKVRK